MNDISTLVDENEVIANRREKLTTLRDSGFNFPNHFKPEDYADAIHQAYDEVDKTALEERAHTVKVAGRIRLKRLMGKASFIQLQDSSGMIQCYVTRQALGESQYDQFKRLDIGDIVGVTGSIFKTKTGELTIQVNALSLLTKSLRPLPDKYHGLADQEIKYRQRYVDLIMSQKTRQVFALRSQVIQSIRHFLNSQQFIEVETPMMHPIPGGAVAKPFVTHHHSLDMPMYLRIAPELYLKRLIVGGYERVYELNRNFRNEGLSTRHNPEFTMLEFYQAFATFEDLIPLTENLLKTVVYEVLGQYDIIYQQQPINFATDFNCMTMREAVLLHNPGLCESDYDSHKTLTDYTSHLGCEVNTQWVLGKLQTEIFEATVEDKLIQPTFITAYPTAVSPLARQNDEHPEVTDRFELFVAGREIANAFSELNDPEEQAKRFRQQVEEKAAGDDEAMHYDADYIRALEYGMPPTAGEGIGIDRLVMLLADVPSIKDVLLFPHLRPESPID